MRVKAATKGAAVAARNPLFLSGKFSLRFPLHPLSCAPQTLKTSIDMSQHNSFKSGVSAASSKRTVLKRFERIDLLKKRGQWKQGKIVGLPKTKPEE